MTIHSNSSNGLAALGHSQPLTSGSSPGGKAGKSGGDNDEVSLSSLSSSLSAQQPDSAASQARLTELASAIGSGNYHINPDALSGSIIQSSITA